MIKRFWDEHFCTVSVLSKGAAGNNKKIIIEDYFKFDCVENLKHNINKWIKCPMLSFKVLSLISKFLVFLFNLFQGL